jgi:hypothetical protein
MMMNISFINVEYKEIQGELIDIRDEHYTNRLECDAPGSTEELNICPDVVNNYGDAVDRNQGCFASRLKFEKGYQQYEKKQLLRGDEGVENQIFRKVDFFPDSQTKEKNAKTGIAAMFNRVA